MYFWLSLGLILIGACFSGVQFARICTTVRNDGKKDRDLSFMFSSALLAFAIPFFSPISQNLGASVSLFIAISAVSTLVVSRSIRQKQ